MTSAATPTTSEELFPRLLCYGTANTVRGTEEVIVDVRLNLTSLLNDFGQRRCDVDSVPAAGKSATVVNIGESLPMTLQQPFSTCSLRQGMLTYVGPHFGLVAGRQQSQDVNGSGHLMPVPQRPFTWCGNFYHDNTGGSEGCVPRGSFAVLVAPLPEKTTHVYSFIGTVSVVPSLQTQHNAYCVLAAGFFTSGNKRSLTTHAGWYNPETFDFVIADLADVEDPRPGRDDASGGLPVTIYVGKWCETNESHKFSGELYRLPWSDYSAAGGAREIITAGIADKEASAATTQHGVWALQAVLPKPQGCFYLTAGECRLESF